MDPGTPGTPWTILVYSHHHLLIKMPQRATPTEDARRRIQEKHYETHAKNIIFKISRKIHIPSMRKDLL